MGGFSVRTLPNRRPRTELTAKKIFFVIILFHYFQYTLLKDSHKIFTLTELEKRPRAFPSSPIRFPCLGGKDYTLGALEAVR
jgi:hypothetical protein